MSNIRLYLASGSYSRSERYRSLSYRHGIKCSFHPWFYHLISLEDTPPPKEVHYRKIFMSGNNATSKKEEEFNRLLQALPDPRPLTEILAKVRANLLRHPNAMLGEVGLDRTFRISYQSIFDPPPKKLSPFSTALDHQIVILEAQLELAVELKRNVSIHSVGSQHVTIDLLQRMKEKYGPKWRAISVDMHSCGLSLEGWKQLEASHCNIMAE
jgi:Tat protein secretion system quality control protein TatD with DNase activity